MQAHPFPHLALPATVQDADSAASKSPEIIGFDSTEDWGRRRLAVLASVSVDVADKPNNWAQVLQDIGVRFQRQSAVDFEESVAEKLSILTNRLQSEIESGERNLQGCTLAELERNRLQIATFGDCCAVVVHEDSVTILGNIEAPAHGIEIGDQEPSRFERFDIELSEGDSVGIVSFGDNPNLRAALADANNWADVDAEIESLPSTIWIGRREQRADIDSKSDSRNGNNGDSSGQDGNENPTTKSETWDRKSPTTTRDGLIVRPPAVDSLRRYTSGYPFRPAGFLRSSMPRGISVGYAGVALVVLAILISGIGIAAASTRPRPEVHPVSPVLLEYQLAIESAIDQSDQESLQSLISGAEQTLQDAEGGNVDPTLTGDIRVQLVYAHDILEGRLRLKDVRLVGQLPEELSGSGASLLVVNGREFLAAGDVYELDMASHSMYPVDISGNAGLDSGEPFLLVSDGTTFAIATRSAVTFLDSDLNAVQTLQPHWPYSVDLRDSHAAIFDGRLYLLDPESGQIYVTNPLTGTTTLWLAEPDRRLPAGSVGMVIDGSIRVIYPDGEVLTLSGGSATHVSTIDSIDGQMKLDTMSFGTISQHIYVADTQNHRLAVFDPATDETTTVELGPDSAGELEWDGQYSFESLTNIVVDEATGSIYWIANDEIWRAALPDWEPATIEN